MEKNQERRDHPTVASVAGLLVGLYFLCPYVYLTPFVLIYGRHKEPPKAILAIFWPVEYLFEHVPPYQSLLRQEGRLLGFD